MMRRRDPGLYDPDLEWIVQGYDRDIGRSGTLSSTVSALEHGGPYSGGADVVEAMIQRLHGCCSAVRRAREVFPRWVRLADQHQAIVLVHYGTMGQLPPRAEAMMGAFAKVGLYQSSVSVDPGALPRLRRALDRGDSGLVTPVRKRAERAVRAAHTAWGRTLCDVCSDTSAGEFVIDGRRMSLCVTCRELRSSRANGRTSSSCPSTSDLSHTGGHS